RDGDKHTERQACAQTKASRHPAQPQQPARSADQRIDRSRVRRLRLCHPIVSPYPATVPAPVSRPTQPRRRNLPALSSRSFLGPPRVARVNSTAISTKRTKSKGRQISRSSPMAPKDCCASAEASTSVSLAVGRSSRSWFSPSVSKSDSSGARFTAKEAVAFFLASALPPATSTV